MVCGICPRQVASRHHNISLQAPQSGGFVSAVDHSEGLKANLEEEGALLQDFHIVSTCKVHPPVCCPICFLDT